MGTLTLTLSRNVIAPSGSPFDAVAPNTWHTFPDTALANGDRTSPAQAAYRLNQRYLAFYKGGAAALGGMWAYSGLTYAEDLGQVFDCASGGHAGYAGNEVYCCELERVGLGWACWRMLVRPTVDLIPFDQAPPINPSSTHSRLVDEQGFYGPVGAAYPVASHTYASRLWMPSVKRVLLFGSEYPVGGNRTYDPVFWFNPVGAWEEQVGEYVLDFPDGNFGIVWATTLNKAVYHGASGLYTYDPLAPLGARQAMLPGSGTGGNQMRSPLYDPKRNRVVSVPLGYNGVYGGLSYWELSNLANVQGKRVLPHGDVAPSDGVPTSFFSGDDAIFTAAPPLGQGGRGPGGNPGFTYNSRKDRYVMWCGDTASDPPRTPKTIWEIHPDTWEMTLIEPGGDTPDISQASTGGVTSTSFFYYAKQDVYLLFNAADRNIMALRPAA